MIDWLLDRFQEQGETPALIHGDRAFSYAWLLREVESWRGRLHNLSHGQICSLEGDYSPQTCALLLALIDKGAVIVPLTSSLSEERKQSFRQISQVEVRLQERAEEWQVEEGPDRADHPLYHSLRQTGAPGLVLFSTGSTGQPKGALHHFGRLLKKFHTPRHRLRTLAFLLLDHIGGLNTLFYTLSNGGTLVTLQSREVGQVCQTIERHRVQLLPTSPTFLNLLLLSEAHHNFDLSSLTTITYGTEPMPEATLKRLHQLFPQVRLLQTYGLSEVGILRSQSRSSDSLWVKVGGEGYQTRVVDGLLHIRAESAMLGYLNAPSPFDEEGWFNTQDEVEVEGEYFRILGRRSELINVGGLKVYPAEVESVLLGLPYVADATVHGEKNPITGQTVVARLTLRESLSPQEARRRIRRDCAPQLESFKIPSRVEIVDDLQHGQRFKRMRGPQLDRLQDRYLEPTPDRQVDQRLMELLAEALIPKLQTSRLLELGVGDQIWTPRLCRALPQVVTVDGSAQLLQAMTSRQPGANWTPVHSLFEDYRPEQPFDCVLATFVLEHVANPLEILRLAARHWLLPGGSLHVAVPHALSLHRRLAVRMGLSSHLAQLGATDRHLEHTHCFTVFELEGLMVEAGFRLVERQGFNCKTLPNRDMAHLSPAQLEGLFWLGNELPIEYAATLYLHGKLAD